MKDLDNFLQADCAGCSCLSDAKRYVCPIMVSGLSAIQVICRRNKTIADKLVEAIVHVSLADGFISPSMAHDHRVLIDAELVVPPTCQNCESLVGCKSKATIAHLIQEVAIEYPEIAAALSTEADRLEALFEEEKKTAGKLSETEAPPLSPTDRERLHSSVREFLRRSRQ